MSRTKCQYFWDERQSSITFPISSEYVLHAWCVGGRGSHHPPPDTRRHKQAGRQAVSEEEQDQVAAAVGVVVVLRCRIRRTRGCTGS